MTIQQKKCKETYKVSGDVLVQAIPFPELGTFQVGNVTAITQNVTTETDAVPDGQSGVGNCRTDEDITEVLVEFEVRNFRSRFMAWSNKAELTNKPAGPVLDEPHSVYKGDGAGGFGMGFLAPAQHIDKTGAVVLTDPTGATTYDEDVDWCFTNAGIALIPGGAIPNPTAAGVQNVALDYAALGTDVLEYFVNNGVPLRIFIDAFNRARTLAGSETVAPHLITMHNGKFRTGTGLPFLSRQNATATFNLELTTAGRNNGSNKLSDYITVHALDEAA